MLSCLCKTLRELGYDARLYMCTDIPFSKNDEDVFIRRNPLRVIKYHLIHFLHKHFGRVKCIGRLLPKIDDISSVDMDGLAFKWSPFIDRENTILIYPEVTFGNPLHAKNVVRWMMYYYPYKETPNAYSINDLFIAYREVFNDKKLNPQNLIVGQAYFDSHRYRQYNFGERNGNCYILRKGRNRADLPEHFDGPVFDDNMSQEELVKMFNEHKYCYSYDTQTFYTTIAAVCGCIPIVVLEPGKTISDYLMPDEKHLGKAYGNTKEQIEYAIRTRDDLLKSLDYSGRNKANALNLVKILEERFGELKRI